MKKKYQNLEYLELYFNTVTKNNRRWNDHCRYKKPVQKFVEYKMLE